MTGHETIVAMRRAGRAPRFVWVSDFPTAHLDGMTVRLAPADVPEQLDLRFLVGLTALCEGPDAPRLARIGSACQAAKARRVITNWIPARDVERTTDTEGVVTWPN
jgi:hypothetical protein